MFRKNSEQFDYTLHMQRPLILVTNDDGTEAKGIQALIEVARQLGDVVAVGPAVSQSGMSHALTFKTPLRLTKLQSEPGFDFFRLTGTPVDCVKMALDKLLDRKPDLILSGINHGSNASISSIYSGTVAAAREGALNNIPSLAFSSLDYSLDADFSFIKPFALDIARKVLANGLESGICLNINFPYKAPQTLTEVRVCRQAKGVWVEEFEKRTDPAGSDYYWLTGHFDNFEPNAQDTDEWALQHNVATIVPIKTECTAFENIEQLRYLQK